MNDTPIPVSAANAPATVHHEGVRFVFMLCGAVCLGVLGGVVVTTMPLVAAAGAVLLVSGTLAVALGARLRHAYLVCLGLTLTGYAFLGRTFSYLGYPPLFIGEIILVVGLLVACLFGTWRRVFAAPLSWAIGAFALWSAVCTVPFLKSYGLEALRDAVIWGYAIFTVIVTSCLAKTDINAAVNVYRRWLILLPAWVPCLFVLNRLFGESAPQLPWADVSLLHFKPTDASVHLAGTAVFLLLGLGHTAARRSRPARPFLSWGFWLVALGVVASLTRGGLLAVVAALVCAGTLGSHASKRRLFAVAAVGSIVAVIALVLSPTPRSRSDEERRVSLRQVITNLTSITGHSSYENLEGTRSWRLEWWQEIASYTVNGRYFWRGKGFGINLADDDGFQLSTDPPLRSPHNIHMTILARSGVPGLLLWMAVLVVFAASMVMGIRRARIVGQEWWSRVGAWILAYWLAALVDASFDVYLEGPAGGVWFWCLMGFGVAVLDAARRERQLGPLVPVGPMLSVPTGVAWDDA